MLIFSFPATSPHGFARKPGKLRLVTANYIGLFRNVPAPAHGFAGDVAGKEKKNISCHVSKSTRVRRNESLIVLDCRAQKNKNCVH